MPATPVGTVTFELLMDGLTAKLGAKLTETGLQFDKTEVKRFRLIAVLHNGGWLETNGTTIWFPVINPLNNHALAWLQIDYNKPEQPITNLVETDDPALQEDHPPLPPRTYRFVQAAEFVVAYIGIIRKQHLKEVISMPAANRVCWYENILRSSVLMGIDVFCKVNPIVGDHLSYSEVTLVDGSILYLTSEGPWLDKPQLWIPQAEPASATSKRVASGELCGLLDIPDEHFTRA